MVVVPSLQQPAVRYTVDDLAQFPDDGKKRELVDGRIVEWDVPNALHAWLMTVLGHLLDAFVFQHRLGLVLSGDPTVRILGSQYDARGPDVAFYARHRLPKDLMESSLPTAPDFVVEIISPSDRAGDVQDKVRDWLRASVRLLWYINPKTGTTTVYYGGRVWHVDQDETLNGQDVLPGFTLRLRDLFERLAAIQAPEADQNSTDSTPPS